MKKFFDLQHPFFRPLWIRIAVTAACLGWAVLEWSLGNPWWAVLFGAIGVYCAWEFFLGWTPRDPGEDDKR